MKALALDVMEKYQQLPISKHFSVIIVASPNTSTGLKRILSYLSDKFGKVFFPFYDGDYSDFQNTNIAADGTQVKEKYSFTFLSFSHFRFTYFPFNFFKMKSIKD